jgi:CRISPR system Cascade subunit CasE
MSLMPDGLGEQARLQAGVLFRLDETDTGAAVLVQSRLEPDLRRLPPGYGTAEVRDAQVLLTALHTGMVVHYRIAANAAKRQFVRGGKGPVVPLSGTDAEEWWATRAASHGLHLVNANLNQVRPARGKRSPHTQPIRHGLTRFDGVAAITDPDLVRNAIENGIGRGRSHGCGLLSLAPARAT